MFRREMGSKQGVSIPKREGDLTCIESVCNSNLHTVENSQKTKLELLWFIRQSLLIKYRSNQSCYICQV